MYLHLGSFTTIKGDNIIGVFDLDTSTISAKTRDYLAKAEKDKKVVNTSYELPKSFIVCSPKTRKQEKGGQKVYLSQLSPPTLKKRADNPYR